LGADAVEERDQAECALVEIGDAVVELLKEATTSDDLEKQIRAKNILEALELFRK
jgi:hypothetical protein